MMENVREGMIPTALGTVTTTDLHFVKIEVFILRLQVQ